MPETSLAPLPEDAERELQLDSTSDLRSGTLKTLPEANVVFLVNFVSPNLLEVFRELSVRFKAFTAVSSVPVEGNRPWKPDHQGIDVCVQKTWTITRTARHPSGYTEPNYVHVPLRQQLEQTRLAENFEIRFAGHCDPHQIQEHYRTHDVMLFPTLGDEWGLVVDESLASGLPVIGSCHSQVVDTIVHDGQNGFRFDPEKAGSFVSAMKRFESLDQLERFDMRLKARQSVYNRTPFTSVSQMVDAIMQAMQYRGKQTRVEVEDIHIRLDVIQIVVRSR